MPVLTREWHLAENSYFLSGPSAYFHRYAGNGFMTKWAGLWIEETKHLEYYAARLDGEWLNEHNTKYMNYNGALAEHVYHTAKGIVTELVGFHPNRNEFIVYFELPADSTLELELAIDIRRRIENDTRRVHEWKKTPQGFIVANELGKTHVRLFSGKLARASDARLKSHAPGGETQTCSVRTLALTGKTIGFSLSENAARGVKNAAEAMKALEKKHGHYQALEKNQCESASQTFEHTLAWSRIGIELLKQKRGRETVYCAGYPWFTQGWGRDTFWSLLGLIDHGLHDDAFEQLQLYAKTARDGRVANFLPDAYNSLDATLLWIIAFEYWYRHDPNEKRKKELMPALEQSLHYLKNRTHESGLLVHDQTEKESWMDTLSRPQTALDIQSLFVHALEKAERLWRGEQKTFPVVNELIKSKTAMADYFGADDFPADRITNIERHEKDPIQTANAALPIAFGQWPNEKALAILKRLESPDFSALTGLRSRARGQPGYDGTGYHTGRVWSLTTAWLGMAQFKLGQTENGYRTIQAFQLELERNGLGCIDETFHGDTNESNGCYLQLWGQALLAHLIDAYMLGIEIDAPAKKIEFKPQLPRVIQFIRRHKKIENHDVVFVVERDSATNTTDCHIENAPKKYRIDAGIQE